MNLNKKEIPLPLNRVGDLNISEIYLQILSIVYIIVFSHFYSLQQSSLSPFELGVFKGLGIFLFYYIFFGVKYVFQIYPESRIEKGWKIPFRKKLFKRQIIQKHNFLGLELIQKEDLTWDIIAKNKVGANITIRNIINKNPALEKFEELQSKEFKSWV